MWNAVANPAGDTYYMQPTYRSESLLSIENIITYTKYYGDMVGELMCETKYSSAKIYVDEHYRQICFKFRDIISDSKWYNMKYNSWYGMTYDMIYFIIYDKRFDIE